MKVNFDYEHLIEIRKKHKFTQTYVGKYLGYKRNTMCQKEKGVSQYTLADAFKLAELYNMSIEELFKIVKE